MAKKNPWVAAILNFFIWGLGYLYVGKKRQGFAIALVIGDLVASTGFLMAGLGDLASAGLLIVSLAFAWDAYQDALGRK